MICVYGYSSNQAVKNGIPPWRHLKLIVTPQRKIPTNDKNRLVPTSHVQSGTIDYGSNIYEEQTRSALDQMTLNLLFELTLIIMYVCMSNVLNNHGVGISVCDRTRPLWRAVTQRRRRRRRTGAATRVGLPVASVAQWIRHRPPKPRIVGSSPTRGTQPPFCYIINLDNVYADYRSKCTFVAFVTILTFTKACLMTFCFYFINFSQKYWTFKQILMLFC